MSRKSIILMAALLGVMPAMAQKNRNVNSLRTEITDSHIVYPKSYEADTQRMLEGWYMQNYALPPLSAETLYPIN